MCLTIMYLCLVSIADVMLCVLGWSVQRLDLHAMLPAVRRLPDGSGTKTPWSLDGANVDGRRFIGASTQLPTQPFGL